MIPKFNIKLTALCLAMILSNQLTVPAALRPIDNALYDAILRNDKTKVTDLLNKGANLNALNNLKETFLYFALSIDKPEIAELLINRGADINTKDISNTTPLHMAVRYNQLEIAELLINRGADINAINTKDLTPLREAIIDNRPEIAELLINHGANIYRDDLLFAIINNRPKIAKLLINRGANINETFGYYNDTPLHVAAMYNQPEIVELLLSRGANIYAKNNKNETVFDSLKKRNKKKDQDLLNLLDEYKPFTPQALEKNSLFRLTLQEAVEKYYDNQPELIKQIIAMPNIFIQGKLKKYFNPKFLRSLYYQFDKPKYRELLQEEPDKPTELELLEESQRENLEKIEATDFMLLDELYQRDNIEKAEAEDYKRLMEK